VLGLLVAFTTIQAQNWSQIGQSILGEAADDASGISVSMNSDGSIVAIGAPFNDGNGTWSGQVRIYENQSGTWTQIGQDINGEAYEDRFGWSISLNSDGTIVAIGAPYNDGNGSDAGHVRIFENQSGTWTQIGQDIGGEAAGDRSGVSVKLSSDGSVVAIGANWNDGNGSLAGQARIFENQSGTWTQIGADIDGEAAGDQSGVSVKLSSDGSVVAIGAPYNNGSGTDSGSVRIFENQNGTWTQIGTDIDGEVAGDESGRSVSLSSDGSVVAVGAIMNDGNGSDAGHVRIFENQSGTWTQIGQDIDGEAPGDESGKSVSISSDGTILAIGASFNDGNGNNSGHVRVYKNQSGTWTQIGQDIDGEAAYDYCGYSVSLSSDGSVVAIGSPWNDENGTDAGHVRIYTKRPTITSQPANQTNVCSGSDVSFTIVGGNVDTYQWQVDEGSGFGDITNGGVYSNATTETLNITGVTFAMDSYQYRCVLSNADGSTTSLAATLTTDTENPAITSTHNDQIVDADTNCEASLLDYTGDVSATDNCDSDLDITQSPTAGTIISGATNSITLTITDDAGNFAEVSFNVDVVDDTNPVITCIGNIAVDADETHYYIVQDTEFDPTETSDNCGVDNVENDFNNLSTLANAQLPEGTTTIVWTLTDIAGNENTCSFDVTVNAYVGIADLFANGISIYPNPTNGIVNLEFAENNIKKLTILDITGKQVIEKTEVQQNEQIDVSSFDSGIYVISIITDNEIFTTKLIKE